MIIMIHIIHSIGEASPLSQRPMCDKTCFRPNPPEKENVIGEEYLPSIFTIKKGLDGQRMVHRPCSILP